MKKMRKKILIVMILVLSMLFIYTGQVTAKQVEGLTDTQSNEVQKEVNELKNSKSKRDELLEYDRKKVKESIENNKLVVIAQLDEDTKNKILKTWKSKLQPAGATNPDAKYRKAIEFREDENYSENELVKFDKSEIEAWKWAYGGYGPVTNNETVRNAWKETEDYKSQAGMDNAGKNNNTTNSSIYQQPQKDKTGSGTSASTLEDMVSDGDSFVKQGEAQYDEKELSKTSSVIYNILLTVGVFTSVIIGAILGIKLMISSAEEKAEVKKMLIPYIVGCIVVFGGFGIWKLVVNILQGI